MHNHVIRTQDVGHLFDLSGIQDYEANEHPAVHLRPRLLSDKSPAAFTARCPGCARCMNPDFTYCCLACKMGGSTLKNKLSAFIALFARVSVCVCGVVWWGGAALWKTPTL